LDVDIKEDIDEDSDTLLMNPVIASRVTTDDPMTSKKPKLYRL
jgi:hypothetical protein